MIPKGDEAARDDLGRTLILGNSGSGKSWLAARMAEALGCKAVDLDAIHWEPGGYGVARDKQVATATVRQEASGPAWVIEGVFGWLAQEALPRATALIWLDLPVAACLDNVRHRGLRRGGDAASFEALLAWAAGYGDRQTSSSLAGHTRMFTAFPGRKLRLPSRNDVDRFVADLRRDGRSKHRVGVESRAERLGSQPKEIQAAEPGRGVPGSGEAHGRGSFALGFRDQRGEIDDRPAITS